MKRIILSVLIACAIPSSLGAGGEGGAGDAMATRRQLSFQQRVDAQRSIDRIYHAYQTTTGRFDQDVPTQVLQEKVRTYLRKSAALETVWRTSITAEMLQAELRRMAASSRMPERLREIYRALDDDPILIQECVARPALVDRLARSFYAADPPDARGDAGWKTTARHGSRPSPTPAPAPAWDEWWRASQTRFDATSVRSVARVVALPEPGGAADRLAASGTSGPATAALTSCSPEGVWISLGSDNVPSPRYGAATVWTGAQFIVWGGADGSGPLDSGGRYDPAIDAWYPISNLNAPAARQSALTVWTGTRMVVWSGYQTSLASPLNTGGLYDPLTDTWTATSPTGVPSGRTGATAVWSGTQMLVWGGYDGAATLNTGARYDPVSDSWASISTVGAPAARPGHSAVWTGDRMIVWGGGGSTALRNDGARYDPASDTWESMATAGAPQPRAQHAAVWTGSAMVVWGGYGGSSGGDLGDGGRYDPSSDTWQGVSLSGAPGTRYGPSVIRVGDAMVVWGGQLTSGLYASDGVLYDPGADAWSALPTASAPTGRRLATAVWTGSQILIWGGLQGNSWLADGGRYDVASNGWLPMASYPTKGFGDVWTGTHAIVWSPWSGGFTYDPATDTTTPISTVGAPPITFEFTTVWTGSTMIVWGGGQPYPAPGVGGIYDPATDSWTLVTQAGAPSGRSGHTAVWTGTRMIVWGGAYTSFGDILTLGDGHAFDPQANAWAPIAASGLNPRAHHTAVWTGSRMIIWGGVSGDIVMGYPTLADGARYDPATNSWSAMSTTGNPVSRYLHTAVWTGSRMIVWGGAACGGGYCTSLASGSRYDPAANTWLAVGVAGAPPPPMAGHAAVWTGHSMIVYERPGVGGQYAPGTDSWTAVESAGAPYAAGHAIWTGSAMGVSRSLFFPDVFTDADGDGWTICDGDCNDARDIINPDAVDECNGIDDDCSGVADDGGALLCVDGQTCTSDICGAYRGCVYPPALDGTGCSDDDACTVADTCHSGSCAPGPARDGDGDAHPDTFCGGDDCDDADAAVWRAPAEVAGLDTGGGTPTPLSWEDQGSFAGPGTAYDLYSGTISPAATVDFSNGSCLMTAGSAFFDDARAAPVPGAAYWYLARARNGCGTGTWGSADADARISLCP